MYILLVETNKIPIKEWFHSPVKIWNARDFEKRGTIEIWVVYICQQKKGNIYVREQERKLQNSVA